jgi:hypothetical protein
MTATLDARTASQIQHPVFPSAVIHLPAPVTATEADVGSP